MRRQTPPHAHSPPPPPTVAGSLPLHPPPAQVYTHGPNYRTLLVANSTSGVGFYPLNAEQDFGEAHTEVGAARLR